MTIERLGGDVPEAGATRPSARRRPPNPNDGTARGLLPAIAGLLALPHIVALVRVLGFDWVPVSDHALKVLRMHDVGTRHTPLVGVYSRFGWNHPGPLFLWVDAPFLRIFGTSGVLAATALGNLAWSLLGIAGARRLGGIRLGVVTGLGLAMFAAASGPSILVDPWNPYIAAPALLCFLINLADFAESGATRSGLVAVIAGSYAVQSHVGTLPVAVAALGAAALWMWSARPPFPRPKRSALLVLGAGLLAWSGPIVQQLTGSPGNLSQLASFAIRGSDEPNPDLSLALGVAARELGLEPPWAGFREVDRFFVGESPIWMLAGAPALLASIATLARGDALVRRACGYAIVLHLAAIAAVTRTAGGFPEYVLRWSWAVGCFSTTVVVWGAWRTGSRIIGERRIGETRGPSIAVVGAFAVATLAVSLTTTVAAGQDELDPHPRLAAESDEMIERLMPRLEADATYNARWNTAEGFSAVATSTFTRLAVEGWDIRFPETSANAVGAFRSGDAPERPTLWLVGSAFPFEAPPDSELLVAWSPLSPEEEARRDELAGHLGAELDMDPTESQRTVATRAATVPAMRRDAALLQELLDRGESYKAYLVPPPTFPQTLRHR